MKEQLAQILDQLTAAELEATRDFARYLAGKEAPAGLEFPARSKNQKRQNHAQGR